MTFDASQLENFVLLASAVTLLAILAVRVSYRAGLPSLLLYLLMGVALGENFIGIGFENAELAHALGFAALALILAEGGLTTSWTTVKPSMRQHLRPDTGDMPEGEIPKPPAPTPFIPLVPQAV